jgi:shikimate kinase
VAKTALIGFMGAGKTTAAHALGAGAVDVDEVIEARLGRKIQDVFAEDGEAAFREVEEKTTLELLADPSVETVALGGGAIGSERVRAALADTRVIWLETVWEDAWQRVERNGSRPLASDVRRFNELHDARRPVYESLADVIVPAARSNQIQAVIDALVGLPDQKTRMLWATSESSD